MPAEKIRVVVGDVGGSFGMKTGLYPEDIVVAYAARQIERPVKWIPTRLDEFLSSTHGRDVKSQAELALDADGKVLGYRVRTLANMGAYGSTVGIIIQLMIGPWVSTSIYDIRTIDFDLRAILTHTAPTAAYRGAGRPEAIYLIERLFDAAAHKLGLDLRAAERAAGLDQGAIGFLLFRRHRLVGDLGVTAKGRCGEHCEFPPGWF